MRELFNDILKIDGVKGVVILSFSGDVIFQEYTYSHQETAEDMDWRLIVGALDGMRETDLIFEKGRIYIRRTDIGYLLILMRLFAPIAILRLNCDIVLPSLVPTKPTRKWGRFFKKY